MMAQERQRSPSPSSSSRQKRPRLAEGDRRRTLRACTSCRKQKERCEGGMPCTRCTRLRRPCRMQTTSGSMYDEGRDSSRLGEAEIERLKLMEDILGHFIGDVPSSLDELRRIAAGLARTTVQRSGEMSTTVVYDTDGSEMGDDTFTLQEFPGNAAHYSGELSHWNFSRAVQRKISGLEIESDPDEMQPEEDYHRAKHLQSSGPVALTVSRWFPPQPVAEFLIAVFFKYGQTNYFYVEEAWVMAKLRSVYEPTFDATGNDSPTWCILLILLAIGTQFVDLDPTKIQQPQGGCSEHEASFEDDVGINFYKLAVKLIPDVLAIASLESVQAFLLLGVYTLPLDTPGLSYTYLGLSLKMAIQNGMHRNYAKGALGQHALEVRNRIWWTVYTLEKRICILHGRPLSISSSDIDVEMPASMPEFQPPNFENLQAIIMLTPYLEAVASTLIKLRSSPKSLQADRLDELVRQSDSLREWWSSLPSEIYCKDFDPQKSMFRANVHLNLAFLLTQIFMGRPFLFTYTRAATSPGSARSKASAARFALACDCIQAAHQILEFCQLLNDHGGLARGSYIEFSSCRTALLVFLAQSLNENTKSLRNCLTEGMNLMRRMTRGIDSKKSELSIEMLERAISRLNAQSESEGRHPDQQPTQYEQFRNWAQLWKQNSPPDHTSLNETIQEPLDASGNPELATEIPEFLWSPSDTTLHSFALEPFFAYSRPMGEGNAGQNTNAVHQAHPSANFESLEPDWVQYQLPE